MRAPSSPSSSTSRRTVFVPPALLLCVALLLFFASWRRATTPTWKNTRTRMELFMTTGEGSGNGLEDPELKILMQNLKARSKRDDDDDDIEQETVWERVPDDLKIPYPIVTKLDESEPGNDDIVVDDNQQPQPQQPQPPSNLVIAGLGDVLFLGSLAEECRKMGNFSHLWTHLENLWTNHAHYTFANFEGTTGPVNKWGKLITDKTPAREDTTVYTTGVASGGFNYHASLATELVKSKIDVLTTANNHAFDRGMEGITTTARILELAGAVQVGSLKSIGDMRRPQAYEGWYRITKSAGWRVAWVGCTTLLCAECRASLRAPQREVEKRVLFCEAVPLLVYKLAKRPDVDVVIVGAHWGAQFIDQHSMRTVELAHQILDAGAAVVYGNHPHVMQGAEHYTTIDGRHTYVAYSLGSLTSGLGSSVRMWKRRTSAILFVEFEKWDAKKKYEQKRRKKTAQVLSVRYVPICEVRVNNGQSRTMMVASSVANKQCDKENEWAKFLLGNKDYVTPDALPVINNREKVQILKDDEWIDVYSKSAAAAALDSDDAEENEVTRLAKEWASSILQTKTKSREGDDDGDDGNTNGGEDQDNEKT